MYVANLSGRALLARFAAFASLLLSGYSFAAGNYSQDFTSSAQNWVAVSGTWQVQNGHYENSTADAPLLRAIAYYGGNTWATDYTYKASLNADYTGTNGANKIGVVFNYTDSNNYYEVLIDMLGNVWLNSVVSGSRSTIASGQVSVPGAVPGIDQWFDVTVTRTGTSVSVRVGGETAIPNTTLPTLPAGRIGVFTHYNHGLFDNVSVTDSYTQDFSSNSTGWTANAGTWQRVSGHYENSASDAPLFRSISYYTGAQWATDYSYKASLNADYSGTNGANKIGMVFNLQDLNNYYEVLIDMLGNVLLNSVVGGTRTTLASEQVNVPGSVPGIDQWFDVTVTRSGTSVSVTVGSELAISNVTLPTLPPGHIGVFTHFNHGRFDNIQVTGNSTPSLAPIFKTGFETGVSVTVPQPVGDQWRVTLTGTENVTGTSFPPAFWGQMTGYMMQPLLPSNQDFDDYLAVSIKTTTAGTASPTGSPTRVLSNTVKDLTKFTWPGGDNVARLGLNYAPADNDETNPQIPHKYYMRRYLKVGSNLTTNPKNHGFLVMQEFKNLSCSQPRRLTLYWNTNGSGQLYYRWRVDYAGGCPQKVLPPEANGNQFTARVQQDCIPGQLGPTNRTCPAVPLGQWFYDEYFAQYSDDGTSEDRLQYAINGQVIFDYRGPLDTRKPRGIKLTPGYLDIAPNVEFQVDDLEVYSDVPCDSFPCGAPQHY